MPYEHWGCSICGKQAPTKYRKHGQFANRLSWLRRHRKLMHPYAFKRSIIKSVETRQSR